MITNKFTKARGLLLVALAAISPWSSAEDKRPNIVLILADDLGFSDIAPFGSEIRTPTLSEMAANGLSFTNYHTAASCAPSRAMLLTGVDHHRNGVPNIPEALPPEQSAQAHYRGVLGHNVVTVATLLQDAGYHTYMAGKWHLGKTPDLLPSRRGFERTVAMADTGSDNWEQKPYAPIYEKANWFADGEEHSLPEDYYSSEYLIDKTLEFIDSNKGSGRPFFAYVPFLAVHIPVQAPQSFIDGYMNTYNEGWTAIREQRRAKAIDLGVVPKDSAMVTMPGTGDWAALNDAEKRYQAKRMAVYAAMVEAMDHHIGRLIAHLKANGDFDNTVFIFTSDNGSEASGNPHPDTPINRFVMSRQGYSVDYDTLGLKGSFNTIGQSFASASASPLAFYKFYAGEGGLRVPLLIAGKGIENQGLTDAFSYVTDITPTILALTEVKPPQQLGNTLRYGGRPIEPMIGRSLLPILNNQASQVRNDNDWVGYEVAGNAALFQGDYKIVLNRGPLGDNRWHLFNIASDPGETRDLAAEQPQRLHTMLANYERYVADNGVLPVPKGYSQIRQVALNGLRDRGAPGVLLFILVLATLLPFWLVYRSRKPQ